MTMLTFFDPDTMLSPDRELTIAEKWCLFHAANPQVFRELERMAGELAARGRKRLGVKMLVEVLRYQFYLTTHDENSQFKISNTYTAFYARLLVETHPEFKELIELRESPHAASS